MTHAPYLNPDDDSFLPEIEKHEKLKDIVEHAEQEARMILPGIQALFGFQLIAVFNASFRILLSKNEQYIHLVAILALLLSTVLVLAPAAFHRQSEPWIVTRYFARLASNFLTYGLVPLLIGSCLDFYLVSRIITESESISLALTLVVFVVMSGFWFVFPQVRRRRRIATGRPS